nr:fimbria/pilus outer membrane usher protein [uncultured Moellerella sp.]
MKINKVFFYLLVYLGYISISHAETQVYFDPDFLEIDKKSNQSIDLSQFEQDENIPGNYYVDIYINSSLIGSKEIQFNKDNKNKLSPCLSINDLQEMGVKTTEYPLLNTGDCINLSAIPDASSEFDFNRQRLNLSIPQIAILSNPRGYVDLNDIDNGLNALQLNYSYSGSKNYNRQSEGSNNTSNYVNLRPGLNVGPWRLRNYTTWSNNSDQSGKWDTVYTYLSRNINTLKSQLILGDSTSPSEIFDSVPFRGAQLATDDDMYPESLRGYAPIVRGIARTNAQITIRQNGYIIYQSDVAAGPFEITDLYSTGSSGDLNVTIKEADGSEQHQIVPFASLPVLQREGRLSYSLTGGEYRSYDSHVDKTNFGQFTLVYGLPYSITSFGGSQLSDKYQSYAFGFGKNFGQLGAVSLDVIHSHSELDNKTTDNGQSYRFRYNKNMTDIGTNIALAGYRYSTKGFYTLPEVFNNYRDTNYTPLVEKRRNRGEITVSQDLTEKYGSLSVGYVVEDYWNSDRKTESASIGYNNSWQGVSYGLNYIYNKDTITHSYQSDKIKNNNSDHLFSLSIHVPFSLFENTAYVNYNMSTSRHGNTNNNIGVSASQLDNRLNWSVQQGYTNKGVGADGNINASYKGRYGEISGGTGYNNDNYNMYYAASGSLVAHSGGITLGQQLGETSALAITPDAKDVYIQNQPGVSTDYQGYALVPYLTPYRKNSIDINTNELPDDTEIELTTQNVSPSRGAIVEANFIANVGHRALIIVTMADGQYMPFGAQAIVKNSKQAQTSFVGNNGEVYLSGLQEQGEFIIQYNGKQQCTVHYNLDSVINYAGLYKIKETCQK